MSATNRVVTDSQIVTDYDRRKIGLGNNITESGKTIEPSEELVIKKNQLIGRVSAAAGVSGDEGITVLKSGASDGSQIPLGIAMQDYVVPVSTQAVVSYYISGKVDAALIELDGSDTLATVVSGKTIRDRIKSDTLGLNPVNVIEHTGFDN